MLRQKKTITPPLPPAQRGLAGGRRILKICLVVLLSAILVFGSCFTVSADSDVDIEEQFGQFKVDYITVVAYDTSGKLVDILNTEVTYGTNEADERGLVITVESFETFLTNQDYTIAVGLFMASDRYTNPNYLVSGSYRIGVSNSYMKMYKETVEKMSYCRKINRTVDSNGNKTSNYYMDGTLSFESTSYTDYVKSSFKQNALGDYYNLYLTKVKVRPQQEFKRFNIALYNFNFFVHDPEQAQLEDIENSINDTGDKITTNQDENTDKVVDKMEELQENEKQEASDTGDKGASDVVNSMPDYSGSLISAFGSLKEYICHENTDCGFNSPAIKIPAIKGFIPNEIVLLEPQWIALDSWFNKITNKFNNVITIVRSLFTIGLILFCMKELYGMFEYLLTLRGGGGSNE